MASSGRALAPNPGAARMNANDGLGKGPAPNGSGEGRDGAHGRAGVRSSDRALDQSSPPSFGGLAQLEEPRVIAALEMYLESLRAGRPWSRSDFLARHSEISDALIECFSGLEFIEMAAAGFASSE